MRGLTMIAGAVGLLAAPVAYKVLSPAEGAEPAPPEAVAAADPAATEAVPAEPVRREMAGGAVFVTARD